MTQDSGQEKLMLRLVAAEETLAKYLEAIAISSKEVAAAMTAIRNRIIEEQGDPKT